MHVLIIPKEHIATFYDLTDAHTAMLGRIHGDGAPADARTGVTGGFRTLVNTGPDGRQEVPHVHVHVMGGPRPWVKGLT